MPSRAELDRKELELERRLDALLARQRHGGEIIPDPVQWWHQLSGKTADPWQARFLRSSAKRRLLDCGRQVGKTDVVAVDGSHKARFHRRRVGILSPTLRQSGIMHRRCRQLLLSSGAVLSRVTLTELELSGGGAVIAFPGDRPDLSVRGDTLDDLVIDEAAYVRDSMIAAASPTQATKPDATHTMLGTPAGQRGSFWEAWNQEGDWERFQVRSEECPRISGAFLARERRRLGPLYAQEYEGAFIAGASSFFDTEGLDHMFSAPFHQIELPEAEPTPELVF